MSVAADLHQLTVSGEPDEKGAALYLSLGVVDANSAAASLRWCSHCYVGGTLRL